MSEQPIECIRADWSAPPQVKALCTTRIGGFSQHPYQSFNLAAHVGDDDKCVQRNRELLFNSLDLPAEPDWLEQTHSTRVVNLEHESSRIADAAITRKANTIAVVMVADCLPILLCNRGGSEVAAIHAGWRGLADGIIETTVPLLASNASRLVTRYGIFLLPGTKSTKITSSLIVRPTGCVICPLWPPTSYTGSEWQRLVEANTVALAMNLYFSPTVEMPRPAAWPA